MGGGVERQGVKHDRVKKGGFNLKCTRICFILCNFVFIAVEEFYVTTAIKSRHWCSFPLNVSRLSVLYQHFIIVTLCTYVSQLSHILLTTPPITDYYFNCELSRSEFRVHSITRTFVKKD